jgi:hypothetical protein
MEGWKIGCIALLVTNQRYLATCKLNAILLYRSQWPQYSQKTGKTLR